MLLARKIEPIVVRSCFFFMRELNLSLCEFGGFVQIVPQCFLHIPRDNQDSDTNTIVTHGLQLGPKSDQSSNLGLVIVKADHLRTKLEL